MSSLSTRVVSSEMFASIDREIARNPSNFQQAGRSSIKVFIDGQSDIVKNSDTSNRIYDLLFDILEKICSFIPMPEPFYRTT